MRSISPAVIPAHGPARVPDGGVLATQTPATRVYWGASQANLRDTHLAGPGDWELAKTVVIRFGCYSKVTDLERDPSYDTRGRKG